MLGRAGAAPECQKQGSRAANLFHKDLTGGVGREGQYGPAAGRSLLADVRWSVGAAVEIPCSPQQGEAIELGNVAGGSHSIWSPKHSCRASFEHGCFQPAARWLALAPRACRRPQLLVSPAKLAAAIEASGTTTRPSDFWGFRKEPREITFRGHSEHG